MTQESEKEKLPPQVYVMCGWPLILVFLGGALGGGLGGAAFGINMALYKSKLPVAIKIILNALTGLAAFVLWIVIASMIHASINGQ